MIEFKVTSDNCNKIYFKTSHKQTDYRSITLKRNVSDILKEELSPRNSDL
ncbi:unnamed protein product [Acanthoscelides obtectus]|uniref:Uncharacterized protein n=1 Tax=Acanthoscelides obtectus TaxID=200917 RepID=A0A9P0JLY5_ACAOB|nr:unnamed protein product [Acanthoscelides obtectus]CAK1654340.1 hypothetical protein AOBTE_LOCUS18532 [Acanthoscelides obtectus]